MFVYLFLDPKITRWEFAVEPSRVRLCSALRRAAFGFCRRGLLYIGEFCSFKGETVLVQREIENWRFGVS